MTTARRLKKDKEQSQREEDETHNELALGVEVKATQDEEGGSNKKACMSRKNKSS